MSDLIWPKVLICYFDKAGLIELSSQWYKMKQTFFKVDFILGHFVLLFSNAILSNQRFKGYQQPQMSNKHYGE